jgi:hypothetical protein
VSESWLTDEEIAEWTSTHDVMREAQVGRFVVVGSYIPTAEVTAYLRTQRDRAQAHTDTLLLAQAASAHDKQAAELDAARAQPWPQGDEAAAQLARAIHDERAELAGVWLYDSLPESMKLTRRNSAAAALAKLAAGEGDTQP